MITFGYILSLLMVLAMVLTWVPGWSTWEADGESPDLWWAIGLLQSLHTCQDPVCWHCAPHRDAIVPAPRVAPILDPTAVRTLPRATIVGVQEVAHLPVVVKSKKRAGARARKEHLVLHKRNMERSVLQSSDGIIGESVGTAPAR